MFKSSVANCFDNVVNIINWWEIKETVKYENRIKLSKPKQSGLETKRDRNDEAKMLSSYSKLVLLEIISDIIYMNIVTSD